MRLHEGSAMQFRLSGGFLTDVARCSGRHGPEEVVVSAYR